MYHLKNTDMRTLLKLLLIICAVVIAVACSNEILLDDQAPDQVLQKAAPVLVIPSTSDDILTKAAEDWNNLTVALQNACPGDIVQLGEGTFYLHKSVICYNFNGTLRGAGKGKTIIRTAPGELFDVSDCPPISWSFELNEGNFMVCFAQEYFEGERSVTVKDLTIIADEPTIPFYRRKNKVPWEECNSLHALMVIYTSLDNDRDHPVNLNVTYKNLEIIGEKGPEYIYDNSSLFSGLSAFGYSNGIFEAINVSILDASGCIKPHGFFGPDSRIIIKDCILKPCTYGIYSFFGHSWTVLNNEIENAIMGIVLLAPKAMKVTWDGPAGKSFVKDNRMHFSGQMGIGAQYVKNVEIKDNIITGSGIYGGIVSLAGGNWVIKDNDLCGVVSTPIFLLSLKNSVITDNINQIMGGAGAADPTNTIGPGRECQ